MRKSSDEAAPFIVGCAVMLALAAVVQAIVSRPAVQLRLSHSRLARAVRLGLPWRALPRVAQRLAHPYALRTVSRPWLPLVLGGALVCVFSVGLAGLELPQSRELSVRATLPTAERLAGAR